MNALENKTQDNIIDINIGGISKKRIRVNGDDNKILLLNTNDSSILERFTDGYSELMEWKDKYIKNMSELKEEADISGIAYWKQIAEVLKPIDSKMREILNYIFNADVSGICDGAMYDIVESGKMRFETILETLIELYGDTIANNYKKMSERVSDLTKDYVKSDS